MIEYGAIYLLSIINFLAAILNIKKFKSILIYTTVSYMFILSAFRGNVGYDTVSYKNAILEYRNNGLFPDFDYLYSLLIIISSYLSENDQLIIIISAVINFFIIIYIIDKNDNSQYFLSYYIILNYIYFDLNMIRSGMSLLLYIAAEKAADNKFKILLFLSSILTHVSTFFLLAVKLINGNIFLKLMTLPLLFITYLIFEQKIIGYYQLDYIFEASSLSLNFILYCLLFILLIFSIKNEKNFNIYILIAILTKLLAFYIFIFWRINIMFNSFILLFCALNFDSLSNKNRWFKKIMILMFIYFLILSIYFLISVDQATEIRDGIPPISPYIPYKIFLNYENYY